MTKLLEPKDIPLQRLQLAKEQENICPLCEQSLVHNRPVLDHDHETGHCRGTLCNSCNRLEGKITQTFVRLGLKKRDVDAERWLSNYVKYIARDHSSKPLHPKHYEKVLRKFASKRRPEQVIILKELGVEEPTGTKKELQKIYEKIIKIELQ